MHLLKSYFLFTDLSVSLCSIWKYPTPLWDPYKISLLWTYTLYSQLDDLLLPVSSILEIFAKLHLLPHITVIHSHHYFHLLTMKENLSGFGICLGSSSLSREPGRPPLGLLLSLTFFRADLPLELPGWEHKAHAGAAGSGSQEPSETVLPGHCCCSHHMSCCDTPSIQLF